MNHENIKIKCPTCGEIMRHFVQVPIESVTEVTLTPEEYRRQWTGATYDMQMLEPHVFICKCGRIDEVNK